MTRRISAAGWRGCGLRSLVFPCSLVRRDDDRGIPTGIAGEVIEQLRRRVLPCSLQRFHMRFGRSARRCGGGTGRGQRPRLGRRQHGSYEFDAPLLRLLMVCVGRGAQAYGKQRE